MGVLVNWVSFPGASTNFPCISIVVSLCLRSDSVKDPKKVVHKLTLPDKLFGVKRVHLNLFVKTKLQESREYFIIGHGFDLAIARIGF